MKTTGRFLHTRAMVDCVMIGPAFGGRVFNVALTGVPEQKTDFIAGHKELPAPARKTTVAVKIIDMLARRSSRRQGSNHTEGRAERRTPLRRLFQIAIALGARAGLTRIRMVWLASLIAGLGGIAAVYCRTCIHTGDDAGLALRSRGRRRMLPVGRHRTRAREREVPGGIVRVSGANPAAVSQASPAS